MSSAQIALIGDYNPAVPAHQAIPTALKLAGELAASPIDWTWVGTDTLGPGSMDKLLAYDAIWCVPASPYRNMDGALKAIQLARESGRPFLGTCAGFQHALIEYARNVWGLSGADHAESNPEAEVLLITPLACELIERGGEIVFEADSRLAAIYGQPSAQEVYHCRYGFNPKFETTLQQTELKISARDQAGEVRAVELVNHPFFIATLFQPERAALTGQAHPLINAFVAAVVAAHQRSAVTQGGLGQ